MVFTFTGGTERERDLVRTAINGLMNLDLDKISLNVEFKWVVDPSAAGHNDLAASSYPGGGALIEIRNNLDVYKGYPPSFYVETVAHEIGHVLTHYMSPDSQAALAELFGTTVAGITTFDEATPWEDRPIEAVAETFKDAFLPNRLRLFTNRTNIKLPISDYDAFRALYRAGAAGGGRFCYTYGSLAYRVTDEWGIGFPLHLSDNDEVAFVRYGHGDPPPFGVEMSQFTESGEMMFSIHEEGGST